MDDEHYFSVRRRIILFLCSLINWKYPIKRKLSSILKLNKFTMIIYFKRIAKSDIKNTLKEGVSHIWRWEVLTFFQKCQFTYPIIINLVFFIFQINFKINRLFWNSFYVFLSLNFLITIFFVEHSAF